jgi:hypothetical protein
VTQGWFNAAPERSRNPRLQGGEDVNALISIAGGLAVLAVGQKLDSVGAAVWWAFLRLTDPGYPGDDVGAWQRFVSTLLTVSGYVVFMGTLVAILTRWLIAKMEELERGLTPITLKDHIVVLGWTRHTLPLLAELSSYHYRPFQMDVISVVGAAERDQLTRRHLGQEVGMDVQHIEADYTIEAELRQLQPAAYDTVMLLSSDCLASGEEADAAPWWVIYNWKMCWQINHGSEMLISPMILSHVLAQVALRRELRAVLDELFTVGGAEIQFRHPGDYTLPVSVDFQLLERMLAQEGENRLVILCLKGSVSGFDALNHSRKKC